MVDAKEHPLRDATPKYIESIAEDSRINVQTKSQLFLKLCSLNYLNALVKKKEFKGVINYGVIKSLVVHLVFDLAKNDKSDLYEEMSVKDDEDVFFIRCYGLQFCFHHINAKAIVDAYPQMNKPEVRWDGIRLQPVANLLYELAKEVANQNIEECIVRGRINQTLN